MHKPIENCYWVVPGMFLAGEYPNTIGHQIGKGGMVYLHCWGGIGRTGTIVGCWLARNGFPGQAALARLRELWKHCPKSIYRLSPETDEQEQYIAGWKEGYLSSTGTCFDIGITISKALSAFLKTGNPLKYAVGLMPR